MQEVVDDHGLEDVELEVALRSGEAHGCRCAMNLGAHHGHRFRLRRIHFARHDRRARFVLRNDKFAKAAPRTGSQPPDVVGDFHHRSRERFERALREYDFVVRGKRGEFVGVGSEGKPGQFGDFLRSAFGKFRMRIQPGANRRSADGEIVQPVEDLLQPLYIALEEGWPTR